MTSPPTMNGARTGAKTYRIEQAQRRDPIGMVPGQGRGQPPAEGVAGHVHRRLIQAGQGFREPVGLVRGRPDLLLLHGLSRMAEQVEHDDGAVLEQSGHVPVPGRGRGIVAGQEEQWRAVGVPGVGEDVRPDRAESRRHVAHRGRLGEQLEGGGIEAVVLLLGVRGSPLADRTVVMDERQVGADEGGARQGQCAQTGGDAAEDPAQPTASGRGGVGEFHGHPSARRCNAFAW